MGYDGLALEGVLGKIFGDELEANQLKVEAAITSELMVAIYFQ